MTTKKEALGAAGPSDAAIKHARPIVVSVLKARFGDLEFPDDMKLSDLGLNSTNLPGIAQNLRDRGVDINNAPIQVCEDVLCLVKAVATAQG